MPAFESRALKNLCLAVVVTLFAFGSANAQFGGGGGFGGDNGQLVDLTPDGGATNSFLFFMNYLTAWSCNSFILNIAKTY